MSPMLKNGLEQERQTLPCPQCGRILQARGLHELTVKTLAGEIHLRRLYFYCEQCRKETSTQWTKLWEWSSVESSRMYSRR